MTQGPGANGGSLRVGLVAPPWFPIPPRAYGGIEWMVAWLAEGLTARGHAVTLVAAGRPGTSARFHATYPEPPSARLGQPLPELVHAVEAHAVLCDLELDVIHSHAIAHPLAALGRPPTVVTAHGPATGELGAYYRALAGRVALVAISDAQRAAAPDLPWAGRVYNAVPVDDYPLRVDKEDWCLWLGRMSPEKAPDLAIGAARAAGRPILLAGKCNEPAELAYFDARVRPLLGPDARWVGEAGTADKKDLLARASCLVVPIQWEEPFGLVMIEAMACGTPVVALARGSVPELVEDNVTGYVCRTPSALPVAIGLVDAIEPKACRQRVADHFDLAHMVAGYEAVYQEAVERPAAGR